MLGSIGINKNIVQIEEYLDTNQGAQDALYESLDSGWAIAQTEGHHIIDLEPAMCQKRILTAVDGVYLNLVIAH